MLDARPNRQTSVKAIAQAAVDIADAEGIAAVSLRKIGARLRISTMGLYRYISGKSDILELMVDQAYSHAAFDPHETDWRATMTTYAAAIRSVMLAHRWFADLPPRARLAMTPMRIALVEKAMASLERPGIDIDAIMLIVDTVGAFAAGATTAELARLRYMAAEGLSSGDQLRQALSEEMRWLLAAGDYPAFETYIRKGTDKDQSDMRFQAGLELLLNGVENRHPVLTSGR